MSNVKAFEPRELDLQKKRGEYTPRCYHRGTTLLDADARTLECAHCGAVLDPYDWLEIWCIHKDSLVSEEKAKDQIYGQLKALRDLGCTIRFHKYGVTVSYEFGGKKATRTRNDWGPQQIEMHLGQLIREFEWRQKKTEKP